MVSLMASRRVGSERVSAFRCVVCGLEAVDGSTLCASHNHQYERLVGSGRHSEAMRLLEPQERRKHSASKPS